MNSHDPKSFLPGPGGFRPAAQPARQVVVPPVLGRPKGAPTAALTLAVSREGHVCLSMELVRALNLTHGQRLELHPPTARNGLGPWHLDCRESRHSPTLTHTRHSAPQFKCRQTLPPKAFCRYLGRGQHGECYERLTLQLIPAPAVDFDYYTLRPVYADPAESHPPR